jgi:hypothetical protein
MPKLLPRKGEEPQAKRFEFIEVIAMEILRTGFVEEVPRGRVMPKDHWLVQQHPQYFRLLGPRPDAEGVNEDG